MDTSLSGMKLRLEIKIIIRNERDGNRTVAFENAITAAGQQPS